MKDYRKMSTVRLKTELADAVRRCRERGYRVMPGAGAWVAGKDYLFPTRCCLLGAFWLREHGFEGNPGISEGRRWAREVLGPRAPLLEAAFEGSLEGFGGPEVFGGPPLEKVPGGRDNPAIVAGLEFRQALKGAT